MKKSDRNIETAVVQILSDFIIWQRVERGLNQILNAYDPAIEEQLCY